MTMTGSEARTLAEGAALGDFGRTDEQLEADIADIDRMLDSSSSWLTPRCRMALVAAREVVVRVLARRKDTWATVLAGPPSALADDYVFRVAATQRRSEH